MISESSWLAKQVFFYLLWFYKNANNPVKKIQNKFLNYSDFWSYKNVNNPVKKICTITFLVYGMHNRVKLIKI